MRKIFLFLFSILCGLAYAADTLTLNLGNLVDYYPQTEDGYWEDTYNDGVQVEDTLFSFSHTGTSDGGGGMAYWDGFTLCTSGDDTNYGEEGSSDGWISKQWGCMAGGGLNEQLQVVKGAPYLVAYWGFFQETIIENYHSLQVDFMDNKPHKAVGVFICNHPWPYYGNINGDGFASAFSKEGDYFALVAHGLNAKGEPTGTKAKLELAAYRSGKIVQSPDWQYFDLTALGTVNGLYFTMETSDADALYGANTAVYFCMDKLRILAAEPEPDPLPRPSGLKIVSLGEDSAVLAWNRIQHAEKYLLQLNDNNYATTSDTAFTFKSLKAATTYQFAVRAVAQKDISEVAVIEATTKDETAPTPPANLKATPDVYSIDLSWDATTDNVGVIRYTIYVNDTPFRRITTTAHTLMGLDPDTDYLLAVVAEDAAGNVSEPASIAVKTLPLQQSIEQIRLDEPLQAVYSLSGQYLGNRLPLQSGTYIIRKNNKYLQLTLIY